MIKKLALVSTCLVFSFAGLSQANDTIFYKSGAVKVIEITSFNADEIRYEVNNKLSSVSMLTVSSFRMYDNEGVLTYNSSMNGALVDPPKEDPVVEKPAKEDEEKPREISVSKHTIALNPFLLPFISPSLKYNYTFGKKMQYSITSRATYLSPIMDNLNLYSDLMIGIGFRLTPFYVKHFALGIDFTPMVGLDVNDQINDPQYLFPLNLNFDFFINKSIGFTFDVGAGTAIRTGNNSFGNPPLTYKYFGRAFFGIMWQFKGKTTFEAPY